MEILTPLKYLAGCVLALIFFYAACRLFFLAYFQSYREHKIVLAHFFEETHNRHVERMSMFKGTK